jgi:hypothetical protein
MKQERLVKYDRIERNPAINPEYKRGFTHRLVADDGGFLFLHKSRVAKERARIKKQKSKRS